MPLDNVLPGADCAGLRGALRAGLRAACAALRGGLRAGLRAGGGELLLPSCEFTEASVRGTQGVFFCKRPRINERKICTGVGGPLGNGPVVLWGAACRGMLRAAGWSKRFVVTDMWLHGGCTWLHGGCTWLHGGCTVVARRTAVARRLHGGCTAVVALLTAATLQETRAWTWRYQCAYSPHHRTPL